MADDTQDQALATGTPSDALGYTDPLTILRGLSPGLSIKSQQDIVAKILNADAQQSKWQEAGKAITAGMQPMQVAGQTTGQAQTPSEFMQDIAAITGIAQAPRLGGGMEGGGADQTMELYKMRAQARTQQAQQINSMIQARGETQANLLGHQMDTYTQQLGQQKDLYNIQANLGTKMADIYLARAQQGDAAAADLTNEVVKIAPAGSDAYNDIFRIAGQKEMEWRDAHGGMLAGLTHVQIAQFVREAAAEAKIGVPTETGTGAKVPGVKAGAAILTPTAVAPGQPGQVPTPITSSLAENIITAPRAPMTAPAAGAPTPTTTAPMSPVQTEMTKQKADIARQQTALQQQYDSIQASKERIKADRRIPDTDKQKQITDLNAQQLTVAAAQREMIGKAAEVEQKAAAAQSTVMATAAQTSQAAQVRNGVKQMRTNVEDAMGMLEDIQKYSLSKPGFGWGARLTGMQIAAQAGNVEYGRLASEVQHLRSTLQEGANTLQGILFPGGGGATDSRVQLLQSIASHPGDNYGQIKANLQQMKNLLTEKGAVNIDLPGGPINEAEFQQYHGLHSRPRDEQGRYFAGQSTRQVKPDGTVLTSKDGSKWIIKGGAAVPFNQ